jgi:hypothetical protein
MRKRTGGGLFEPTKEMEVEPITLPPTLNQPLVSDSSSAMNSPEGTQQSMMDLLGLYSPTGAVPSPLDRRSPFPISTTTGSTTTGGSKFRRIRKRSGGYKDPNTNLNTNVPALGAPLTREQLEILRGAVAVQAPLPTPTGFQPSNANGTRSVPSNNTIQAAGVYKKTRRTRRRKRTRRTRSKK